MIYLLAIIAPIPEGVTPCSCALPWVLFWTLLAATVLCIFLFLAALRDLRGEG